MPSPGPAASSAASASPAATNVAKRSARSVSPRSPAARLAHQRLRLTHRRTQVDGDAADLRLDPRAHHLPETTREGRLPPRGIVDVRLQVLEMELPVGPDGGPGQRLHVAVPSHGSDTPAEDAEAE